MVVKLLFFTSQFQGIGQYGKCLYGANLFQNLKACREGKSLHKQSKNDIKEIFYTCLSTPEEPWKSFSKSPFADSKGKHE